MHANVRPLSGEAWERTEQLRARMDAAGCVFDFSVRAVAPSHVVTEADHRALLQALFDEVQARAAQWRAAWLAQNPQFKDASSDPVGQSVHDVAQARATPWDARDVADATTLVPGTRVHVTRPVASVTPFEWLFQAFDNPPYGARCEPGLFADFCRTVGLLPHPGLEVLDWVGDAEAEPERSDWSDYFDDGKEWWGIWCLTVWNPQQRTLAALVASATD